MQKVLKQIGIKSISSNNELRIFGKGMIDATNKKVIVPNLGDHRICMSLYRYASFLIIRYKPKNKVTFLKKKFKKLDHKKLNKINLHSPEISAHSALIAKIGSVRKILKKFQTSFSKKYKNCCIEGRDISTKILPHSEELKKIKTKIKLKEVKKALRIRNISDTKRKNSPLLKHRDSVSIDTGKLNKQAMLAKMSKYVERIIKLKYGN